MKHRTAIVSFLALALLGTGFALPGWWVGPQTGYHLYLGAFGWGIDGRYTRFEIPHDTKVTNTDAALVGGELTWRFAMVRVGVAGHVGSALGKPENVSGTFGYGGLLGELVLPMGIAELTPGILLGGGSYAVTDNTNFLQWSQEFAFCNPSLALDVQVAPGFRLGLVGTWMMGRPEIRGWSAGLRASFGETPMKYRLRLVRRERCCEE